MRVLWLSNIQTSVTNNGVGCSWVGSLENELSQKTDIQLGISFNTNQPDTSEFSIGNTKYFPLKRKRVSNSYVRLLNRFAHKIEKEDRIESYYEVIKKFHPDLIHIFGSEGDYGLIAEKTSVPCILHIQGNLTIIDKKWYSGFTPAEIFKYSDKSLLIKGYGLFHDYLAFNKMVIREQRILKSCRNFMGRTDWDRRITSILSPGSKYFHCDEIMRPSFYSQKWELKSGKKNIVIFSTFKNSIYKGLETVFECKRILDQNFPELIIEWNIAGIRHTDEICTLVERKFNGSIKDLGVNLLGPLQEENLVNEMLKADMFVHASHIENSPNSVCEAMLLGMPVIATYAGGTASMLTDMKEGLLIQDGDPYSLGGAIIELIQNRDFAKNLGDNARVRGISRNDPQKIVNDILNIYSSVVKDNMKASSAKLAESKIGI
jgi:glycosyltransferase involved in cell wall biosynthesis